MPQYRDLDVLVVNSTAAFGWSLGLTGLGFGVCGYVAHMNKDSQRPSGGTRESLGIGRALMVAVLSVGSGWAVNAIGNTSQLSFALVAITVGLLLYVALEVLNSVQGGQPPAATRRRALSFVVAAIVAAGILVVGVQLSRSLPCQFRFTNADMLFCDNFHDPGRDWTTMNAGSGAARYTHGGLTLRGNPGYALWEASPAVSLPAAIRITAKARMVTTGAGVWGVWCRGTADGSRRYEFSVSHTGTTFIKIGDQGRDQRRIDGFQADEDHTVEAVCRDLPDSGGIELIMDVDGKAVGHVIDNSNSILGPGRVGVHAATFGDVPTTAPTVLYRQFTVERDHG